MLLKETGKLIYSRKEIERKDNS